MCVCALKGSDLQPGRGRGLGQPQHQDLTPPEEPPVPAEQRGSLGWHRAGRGAAAGSPSLPAAAVCCLANTSAVFYTSWIQPGRLNSVLIHQQINVCKSLDAFQRGRPVSGERVLLQAVLSQVAQFFDKPAASRCKYHSQKMGTKF